MKLGRLIIMGLVVWLSVSSAAFAASLARLIELKGEVSVLTQGDADWHPAREAEELSAGDAVKTGTRSEVTVARHDGTTVALLPFAQLVVEDERGFLLQAGRVWSHFTKALGAPFFIRTPHATALIRGTTLGVDYEEERSRVTVYEGLVEVRDREERSQDVAGGFRVDVDRMGRLQRLERAENRELDEGRTFRLRRGLERAESRGVERAMVTGRGGRAMREERQITGVQRELRRFGRQERQELRQQRMDKVERRLEDAAQRVRQDQEERRERRAEKLLEKLRGPGR
ncbi:FecR domain-containing protein [bacterium]|nr:FecR domain-containing protein [bacterium]